MTTSMTCHNRRNSPPPHSLSLLPHILTFIHLSLFPYFRSRYLLTPTTASKTCHNLRNSPSPHSLSLLPHIPIFTHLSLFPYFRPRHLFQQVSISLPLKGPRCGYFPAMWLRCGNPDELLWGSGEWMSECRWNRG